MKKVLAIAFCLLVSFSNSFAQDVFLSLTKYDVKTEELPTNVTVITQEDIENKHVETLGELLANEAGIFYKTNGTAGDMPTVFMRGAANAARTLVLIDGHRVNNAGDGSANFAAIPASVIERVEIIRGSGSAVYGTGAFGGVINVITKKAKAQSPIADFGFSYGSNETFNPYTVIQHSADNLSLLLGGNIYQTNGYRPNSDYKGTNLLFNGSINITGNSSLTLSANSYDADFGYPGSQIYLDPGRRKDHAEYARAEYNLNIDDKTLKVSVYHSENEIFNDSAQIFYGVDYGDHSKTSNKTQGVQADFIIKSFLFGAEFYKEYYNTQNTVDGGITSGILNVDKNRDTVGFYAQWNAAFGKLHLIPSLRYDYNSAYYGIFTPSFSAVYNILQNLKVAGNVGKVWRAPTFNDLYSQWGANPGLKPEEGVSSDIGIEFTQDKIKASVTGYYINSDNLIISNANTGYIPENIDKSQQYGVEIGLGYIITKWLNASVNYTYLNAENKSEIYKGKKLQFSPQNTLNAVLNIKPLEELLFSATVGFKDKYYYDADNSIEMNGFSTLDLSVNYRLNEKISFWIKGFNIANADYQIVDGYPMPKAAIYFGTNVKF
ncbi:MAG: TonB-dependent receptor [Endomicrobium sp.]|jgi:outer membrane cobalamin receptor|nr:TonB-dependent receptor [Endomicrobium sp.]